MTSPVIIEDYDPRWPQHFEILQKRILAALGSLATAIEHIGSTAVPGLAAKPIIDLDVLLRSDADLAAGVSALASLGYVHQGDLGIPGRDAFQAPPDDLPHHLYLCSADSNEFSRHLAFRNHLRTHPQDANIYAILKRKLATEFATNRDAYTRAKSSFVEEILFRIQAGTAELSFPSPRIIHQ